MATQWDLMAHESLLDFFARDAMIGPQIRRGNDFKHETLWIPFSPVAS